MRLTIYTDGGSDGNGEAFIGVLLIDQGTREVVYAEGHAIGPGTNNEAEYAAVIAALYKAQELGATAVMLNCDSRLVVNQVNGTWLTHENHLKVYVQEVLREKGKFEHFEIQWIPRQQNKIADKLSRLPR